MTVKTYQTVIEVIKPYIASPPTPPVTPDVDVAQFLVEVAVPVSNFHAVAGSLSKTDLIMGYVRSLERRGNLCTPGQTAVLTLTPDYPYNVNPGQPVVLYEYGVMVLTGYVVGVSYSRPSHDIVAEIEDTYTRMKNYFIPERELTTAGHDTTFWVDYLCWLSGNTYKVKAPARPVPAGIQLGLRTAHEALQDILAYASWYVWPDPDGTLVFSYVTTKRERNLNDIINIHYNESSDQTRNVIKVFGTSGVIAPGSGGGQITSIAHANTPGLLVDMTAAVGAPLVGSQTEADREAQYLLDELGSMTKVIEVDIPGDPTVRVGSNLLVSYDTGEVKYGGQGAVMALETHVTPDDNGYTMNVTLGERCPRIAGFTTNTYILAAGTRGGGVLVSRDRGSNWEYWNQGLPDGPKYTSRVAVNTYGEGMAIVNDKLYYSAGGAWSSVSLPDPVNSADDPYVPVASELTSFVAVDALGGKTEFAVLANGRGRLTQTILGPSNIVYTYASRAWVYSQSIDETTGSARWDSVGVGGTDLTSGSTSYTTVGYDLSSRAGAVYVLASTASGSYQPPPPPPPVVGCMEGFVSYKFGPITIIDWTYSQPNNPPYPYLPFPNASLTTVALDTNHDPLITDTSAAVWVKVTWDAFNAYPWNPTVTVNYRYRTLGSSDWTYTSSSWSKSIAGDPSYAQWETFTAPTSGSANLLNITAMRSGNGFAYESEARITLSFAFWDDSLGSYNTASAWTDWGAITMSGKFCMS